MRSVKWFRQHSPSDNAYAAVVNLLRWLEVPVTNTTVEETLKTNYTYPSLAAIGESLEEWGIESMVVKIPTEKLSEVEFPCIAHLNKNNGHFVILTDVSKEDVTYIDPEKGIINATLADFARLWSGVIMLVNKETATGEKGYEYKRKKERIENLRLPVAIGLIIGLIVLTALSGAEVFTGIGSWWSLLLIKSAGVVLSVFLLLHYFTVDNAFMQKLCPAGNMLNCKSVLHSPAAKIFNIPMADIGALYFTGGLFALLFTVFNSGLEIMYFLLAVINLFTLPYTLFSIFYQAFVIREWCWMCVCIQTLFWLEFLVFISGNTYNLNGIQFVDTLPFLWAFMLPLAMWLSVRPVLEATAKIKPMTQQLLRLKNNPYLFWTALTKQPKSNTALALPIETSEGPRDAAIVVTMASNPQCPQCILTHQFLEELAQQFPDTFRYVIRFYCPVSDRGKEIARRVIAITLNGDKEKALKALNKGYKTSTEQEYIAWKKEFDTVAENEEIADQVLEMHLHWATAMNIKATPAFFVNDHPLPNEFTIYDLKSLVRLRRESQLPAC